MDTATIPTWHHPHYISHETTSYGVRWQFKAFTGDEPEPKIPADVHDAFTAAYKAYPWDSETGRAVRAAYQAAEREESAANTMWQVARYNRRVIALLQQVAPLVAAFHDAKRQAVDAYEQLHATPDGFWQANLLTLMKLRETALDAARQLDGTAHELATCMDGLPERVLEAIPTISDLEKAAGVDFGDWYARESYPYSDGPDVKELTKLFAEQDERIAQVTRLFAGEGR